MRCTRAGGSADSAAAASSTTSRPSPSAGNARPRGVGVLAIRPALAQRLRPRLPPPDWDLPLTVLQRLETGDANVAARVGYSVALGEHLAAGPDRIRARLAELGHATRTALADVAGWRVVEPVGEPTAITTLTPLDGADPQKVRSWLIAERGIVTTYAEMQRAPFELHAPVLRVSPHVDSATEDLDGLRRGAGGGDGTTVVIAAKAGRSASPKG